MIRKLLTSVANWLFAEIVYSIHRYFVNLRRPYAMAEAKFILEQIKKGTALAEAKMVRLSHLQEHYRITNAELGLTDNNDLPNRVTISLALAEKRSQPKALAKVPVIKETKEQEPTQIRVC